MNYTFDQLFKQSKEVYPRDVRGITANRNFIMTAEGGGNLPVFQNVIVGPVSKREYYCDDKVLSFIKTPTSYDRSSYYYMIRKMPDNRYKIMDLRNTASCKLPKRDYVSPVDAVQKCNTFYTNVTFTIDDGLQRNIGGTKRKKQRYKLKRKRTYKV
jgi:hypothetical protein